MPMPAAAADSRSRPAGCGASMFTATGSPRPRRQPTNLQAVAAAALHSDGASGHGGTGKEVGGCTAGTAHAHGMPGQ
jgi:hypothetical protein